MAPLTTLTLWRFPRGQRAWAFAAMGRLRAPLSRAEGLRFWRLCGTGVGLAFSLEPDLSRYALLAVWDSAEAAAAYLEDGEAALACRRRASEEWSARLLPLVSRGAWGGTNPFLPVREGPPPPGPVAVLTRATLRLGASPAFWADSRRATLALEGAQGCLASVGIGEAPLLRLGTFSLWRDQAALRAYAYENEEHRRVIRARQVGRYYKEELFARFCVVGASGTWAGRDPLAPS